MSKPLTEQDREYGRRFRKSRGKRPIAIIGGREYRWGLEPMDYVSGALPAILYCHPSIRYIEFPDEQSANDALDLVLRECREACGIPGEVKEEHPLCECGHELMWHLMTSVCDFTTGCDCNKYRPVATPDAKGAPKMPLRF